MATRLSLYNNALLLCGERALASLTENREPRRVLDQIWDSSFIKRLLEQGDWNFAMRSVKLESDPDYISQFGYQYLFTKPEDWCRTAAVCSDEYFDEPLLEYSDENGKWFSSIDPAFVEYVSDDIDYGADLSKWPENFTEWAEHNLALRAFKRLTQASADLETMKRDEKRKLFAARSKDARGQPTAFPPSGRWSRARGGIRNRLGDRKEGF